MSQIKRRVFLLGSMAAPMTRPARAQTPDGVRVGMIGVGNRGAHTMRVAMTVTGVKVTAVCDIKPDRLDRAASAAVEHNPKTYTDYRKLLDDKSVDAVHISTPCDLHVEHAIAALRAGKHVFLEKPVGITAESIAKLLAVARASKTVLTVGQQMRSSARLKAVAARLRDGVCGDVVMIKAQRHAGGDLAHDGSSADWFFDASRSGDVIVEMSVHNLDVCNWMMGEYPAAAAGFGGALVWRGQPAGRTNMDGYTLSYEYPGGGKLSYTQVFFHARGLPNAGQLCHVYGTKGSVDVDNAVYYPLARDGQPEKLFDPQQERLDNLHIQAFYDAIRTGSPNPAGIEIGVSGALTAILGRDAIYQKRVKQWSEFGIRL